MLSLDDFSGVESTSNMTPMDKLLAVTEVASLIAEQDKQFRMKKEERDIQSTLSSSSPQVLDHQKKTILDFFIPRKKRSMTRQVTEKSFCYGGESKIKKAVENNSEVQEFFRLENRTDDRGNRVFKINSKGNDIIRKRSQQVANDNQEHKKIKRNITVRGEVPAPVVIINRELDIEFKNLITLNGGSLESLKLVIEKRLFQTDVKPAEGRLSIPQKQMINSFLEPGEDARNTRNGGKMSEMRVMLIEPSRRVSEINLRKWFMNKDNGNTRLSYVLVTYWNEVVRRNELKVGTKVQLWAFRKGTDLCFALVKLQD